MADVEFSIRAKNQTQKTFAAIKSSIGSLNTSVVGLASAVGGLLGVGAFGVMAKNALSTADKIHKLNIRLGASTEALSQYRHVADLSGVSFETLTTGWQRMTRRISESAQGTGMAKKAFEELGVDVAALAKMKPEQQFEILAEAISKVEDPADRVRLAMKIFGSEGVSLLQTMEGGAAGLQKMREEADALGMTMSKDMVTGVANLNDSITRLSSQITSIVELIMGEVAPAIEEVITPINNWISANRELIGQKVRDFVQGITDVLTFLSPLIKAIAWEFNFLGDKIAQAMFAAWQIGEKVKSLYGDIKSYIGGGSVQATQAALATGTGTGTGSGEMSDWEWSMQGGSYGNTVVNNFNTQVSRSDAVAIANESARQASRQ